MKYVCLIAIMLLSCCAIYGQDEYSIPLPKENSALTVPSLARRGAKLYVAYRSFNWVRFSSRLEVLEYDQSTRKLLRHVTTTVPKVHGARAAQGLFISPDGRTLAYAEAYSPKLLLLLSTADLSEIRRSTTLPFTADDYYRQFAGFTKDGLLAFSSVGGYGSMRFLRLSSQNLNVVSDTRLRGTKWIESFAPAWLASDRLVWGMRSLNPDTDEWMQYTEKGERTGQKLHHASDVSCYGAVPIGGKGLLVFYGNMVSKGFVVSYNDHRTSDLKLGCLPSPYSTSNDQEFYGAVCATVTDRSEPAHNKLLTSEFLLLKTSPLKVIWHHPMSRLAVANGNGPNAGFQEARPLIFRSGKQIWIVSPSKSRELTVYRIPLPK